MKFLLRKKARDPQHVDVDPEVLAERRNIVTFNGKQFVSGLFWQQLSSPHGFMKEARAIGQKNGWDVVAIRRGLRIQAGFVSKKIGAIKGMYSLAATLAGQLGPFWLGAFDLGDGRYAIVGVKDSAIIPGFDLICDRDQALEKLHEGASLMSFPDESIYAPSDFSFSAYERKLEDLLAAKRLKAEYKLKQLKFGLTTKELTQYSLCAVLIAVIGFSLLQYQAYEQRKARELQIREAARRAAELKRLNENTKKQQTAKALDHPWAKAPSASEFTQGCIGVINATPLSVGGWTFASATCDMNGVEVVYKRNTPGTTVTMFLEEAQGQFEGVPQFKDESKTVAVRRTFKAQFTGDHPLQSTGQVLTDMTAYFQGLDMPVRFEDKQITVPQPPAPTPGAPAQPAPVPDWKEIAFSFKSELSPDGFDDVFSRHPGLRVQEIKVDLKEGSALEWNIKGEIYASL